MCEDGACLPGALSKCSSVSGTGPGVVCEFQRAPGGWGTPRACTFVPPALFTQGG